MKAISKRLLYLLFAVILGIVTVFGGQAKLSAFADSADSVQANYESTNVLDNLNGSTIGGKQFDISDYPHNENGQPQVISLTEFCYSYYADNQGDYGLYVYLYNPQDRAIDTQTERNKIQLTYADKPQYEKYILEFLNYSVAAGYEGRFYKFKVRLTESEKAEILSALQGNERVYKVAGIEISVKNDVTEYPCAQTYTYTGFALGYGSELSESDTLSCKVDGFDKYLSLDVRSTYWRPQGTHADGYTRDTIHSVYFSVPDEIITEYGEMTGVHATWLNAYTAPIYVTGNKTIYDAVLPLLNEYVGGDSQEEYEKAAFQYSLIATKAAEDLRDDTDMAPYGGYYAFNPYFSNKAGDNVYVNSYDNLITNLRYLFYAENGNADEYVLPAERLIGNKESGEKGWFESYTEKYGGELVNDRYSRDLFAAVDERFTEVNITSNQEYKLQDMTVSDTAWKRLFGTTVRHENSYTFSAIQKVTVSDLNLAADRTAFCNSYFIAESDYDEFSQYVTEAAAKRETVYLFRYNQTEYVSNEATEYERDKQWYLFGGNYGSYKYVDTNAYFAQMWVQLDFDIIDLTFTKDNAVTVIPVVMSPMDIAADGDHPASTQPEKGLSWWQILLIALAAVVVIILFIKLAPSILTLAVTLFLWLCRAVWWLICAPYKCVRWIVEKIKEKRG